MPMISSIFCFLFFHRNLTRRHIKDIKFLGKFSKIRYCFAKTVIAMERKQIWIVDILLDIFNG